MLTNSREGELIDQETGTSLKKVQKEKGKITDCFPSQAFNYTYYVCIPFSRILHMQWHYFKNLRMLGA